jgi:EmrB/QacA subfamily drug resistance transporter
MGLRRDISMHDDITIKRSALLIATLAAFLTPFMVSSINIALPAIGGEFQMSAVLLSWVPTAYLLSAAMCLVPFGRLADIVGRKRIFAYGMWLFTASSLLLAFSQSAPMLIAFRVLQGFGSAMIFGTGMAILTSVFPASERGRVLGINVAAVYLGLSLGPVLGGFLTQQFGWRSIFLVNVPLGIAVIYLVSTKLKAEWAEAGDEKFDLTGSILYSAALVVFMYGLSLLPARTGMVLVPAGIAGGALFIRREMKTTSPLLNMNLFFYNAAFAFSNLAALINYSATFAVTFLMSLYLQYIKGFNPQHAGLILVAQPLIMAVFSPLAGRLSDRIEPRIVASIGMGFTAAGLFLFTTLHRETHLAFIVAGLVLLGFGFALFSSPNTNAVMSSIEKRFYGVGSATLGTMRLTGQMFSMGIAMVIFAVHIGSARITPEYYPQFLTSLRTGFIIFSSLCFGGIFASLARGKVR